MHYQFYNNTPAVEPCGRETLRATLVILRQYAICFRMGLCLLIFYKKDLENQDKNHVWPSIEGFYSQGTNSGLIKFLKSSQAKGFSCQWPKVIPSKSTGYFLTWLKSEEKNRRVLESERCGHCLLVALNCRDY